MKARLSKLLHDWFGIRKSPTVTHRACPWLELLENRLVPTAHTFTVTTNSDAVVHTGVSLRDAIHSAETDANPGDVDVIKFASSLSGKTVKLVQGALTITQSVSIQGLGASYLAIDGGAVNGAGGSQIFNLVGGEGSPNHVTIAGVTLQNGDYQTSSNPEVDGGGAIGATNFGLNFFGPANVDSLTVNSSVVKNNTTNGVGGAISVTGGNLTIQNSTFNKNTSGNEGGAVAFDDAGNSAQLQVNHTGFTNNATKGEQGGALSIQGGTNTINACTFSGNVSGGEGGAISNRPTGTELPVPTNSPNTTIVNTTFSGNSSHEVGGAIWNADGALTLRYDTISQNTASGNQGGGIFNDSGVVNIIKSIVANNHDVSGANDIRGTGAFTYNAQDSLIQAVPPLTINGTNQHNLFNVAAMLMPLGYYYGGTFQTQPPMTGSPALKFATFNAATDPAVDENGNSRHNGLLADIGAVETPLALPGRRGT